MLRSIQSLVQIGQRSLNGVELAEVSPVLPVAESTTFAPGSTPYPAGLSAREIDVLRLIAAGRSNPKIAELLTISLNTVTRHISHIFNKTGTGNRVEAAMFAMRHEIEVAPVG